MYAAENNPMSLASVAAEVNDVWPVCEQQTL
jgi:hypothetical protein